MKSLQLLRVQVKWRPYHLLLLYFDVFIPLILSSFAESLLKQIQADVGDIDMGAGDPVKPEGAGETPPHSSEDEAITKVRTLDIPIKLETVRSNVPVKYGVNIGMKGSEITEACADFAKKNISISKVIDAVHSLPHVPERPKD
jgi:hypothetical protein